MLKKHPKMHVGNTLIVWRTVFFLVLLLTVGCTAVSDEPADSPAEPTILDETTGLPLNPEVIPEGEFIVEGIVVSVNVIPQDKPLFKIESESSIVFQISSQPVSDIFMIDGSELMPLDFTNGMVVRATVFRGDDVGLGGEIVLTSTDLAVISLAE